MKSGTPFRFPLGFDPMRLLLAVRDHAISLILLTTLGLIGGGALGYKLFKRNTYTVAAILSKTSAAEGESLFGENAYCPDMLRDQALEEIAMGHQVLTKLGAKFDPPETVKQLEERLSIRYDTQQKWFYLEAKGPSEKLAIVIANQWAELVVQHSKELMQSFASNDANILKEDYTRLEGELVPINNEIDALAQEDTIVDAAAAYASLFAEIESLKGELRTYEIQEATYYDRRDPIVKSLLELHPLKIALSAQKQELASMQDRGLQPGHGEVLKAKDTINNLEKRIAEKFAGEPSEELIRECNQSESAALLYERYLALKDEQFKYEEGIRKVKLALEERQAKMKALPLLASKFRKLQDDRAQIRASLDNFNTQINNATFYAQDQTPGYLKSLQPAEYGMADLSTGKYKTIASGLLLAGLLCGTVLLWAILRELRRPQLRTMLQAAITTRATPVLSLLQKDEIDEESAVREFWLSHVAKQEEKGRRILFPIVGDLKTEFTFWKTLLHSIKQDNALVLFVDVAQEPVPESFLKANLLPFSPSPNAHRTASTFLQGGGSSAEDLWKNAGALGSGSTSSDSGSSSTVLSPSKPAVSTLLAEKPQGNSGSALSTTLMPSDQPIIPHAGDVSQSARYVSAADYSTEKLARLLRDLPPHYYVVCRWAIGPTSSLASISKDFDQHFLLNSPVNTNKKVASSQSRIFRRILGTPSGIVFLNEPAKGVILNLIHRIQSAYFHWKSDTGPKKSPREQDADDDAL